MSKFILSCLLVIITFSLHSQKVIFLHHSTGGGVYNGSNGLDQWFVNYNTAHGTSYQIEEFEYPNTPYEWSNYAYDYWNLWINQGKCDNSEPGIRCLDWFTSNYDVIIFKHCYPGAGILADLGTPTISSSRKSLENYMLQYRALRDLMDTYPNNKFIVWTLAPLHRLAANSENASRARQFVNWVKNDWLSEDGKTHPNIYIFDFYGYAAELNASPANGVVNCLKYNYEKSHTDKDSHPNPTANATIMPFFGQFIVDVLQNQISGIADNHLSNLDIKFYPNPAKNFIKISGVQELESIDILGMNGAILKNIDHPKDEIDVSFLAKGTYILRAGKGSKYKSQAFIVE
jgi:hypothetical protein